MNLEILPNRPASAAENMAVDFLLLQRYPTERAGAARFRHYAWRSPAFTFGYGQKIVAVRAQLSAGENGENIDLCRRPTGGGIVDHRCDWTYALVLPRGHPLEELAAAQSYRAVHEALAAALREQDVAATLKPTCASDGVEAGQASDVGEACDVNEAGASCLCFRRAEMFDVVQERTGEKIAGAAQKRNKHGLLFQGSIWRPAVTTAAFDWDQFEEDFVARLAIALGADAEPTPWPEWNDDELGGLVEQYASPEWIERR